MNRTLTIAGWELRAAVRTRWVLGAGAAFAASASAISVAGLHSVRELGLAGVGPASAGLLGLAMLLPPLLGLLMGAGSLAGAREKGLLGMVVVQPVGRGSVVLGTFLGLTAAMLLILAAGLGGAGIVLAAVARPDDLLPLAALAFASAIVATASVALGIGISALAPTRSQATAWAVTAWFILALGVDLALAGLVPALSIGPQGLLVAILANPIEASRVLALLGTDAGGTALGPFGAYAVARYGTDGTIVLLVASIAGWSAAALAGAHWSLTRRDV